MAVIVIVAKVKQTLKKESYIKRRMNAMAAEKREIMRRTGSKRLYRREVNFFGLLFLPFKANATVNKGGHAHMLGNMKGKIKE